MNDENLINERVLKRKGGEGGVVERFSMINNVCFVFFFLGGDGGGGFCQGLKKIFLLDS